MGSTNKIGIASWGVVEVGKDLPKELWREGIWGSKRVLEGIELNDLGLCAEDGEPLFLCFASDVLANVVDGDEMGRINERNGSVDHGCVLSRHG